MQQTTIKYLIYARKSSESEDRQVQSIDDQIRRLKALAMEQGLSVAKIYTEAKSAKQPDNRPLFEEMMQIVENDGNYGILCWHINRLSRNPIDSARIQWLLQRGMLKSIQTVERQYLPEDNVLLLSVESGMANQYVIDLSKSTKRGMLSKLEKGWMPNCAPVGYLNDRETSTILKDPERFDAIRKLWDLMMTGSYTVKMICDVADKKLHLTTKRRKRIGGKRLSLSGVYSLFRNPFYTGAIEWDGKLYPGKHDPMITTDEFERVQSLLHRKSQPRPKRHSFAFTGFIRCGECGCLYTAEKKRKLIKQDGEWREYTYYHCTRKKRDVNCSQRSGVREDELKKQILFELDKYTILPDFLDWALDGLNRKNDREIDDRSKLYESQHQELKKAQNELDELTKMRYRQLIDDTAFIKERDALQESITNLKTKLRETEARAEKWIELTEQTFHFAAYARIKFIKGDWRVKKEILMALGQNPTIKDGKLHIEANEWLQPIAKDYPALEAEYLRLELNKTLLNKAQSEALTSLHTRWLARQDSFRTFDMSRLVQLLALT